MNDLFKEPSKVVAGRNDRTVAEAEGYVDGQIARKHGKVLPKYVLVGRDEYCMGFRAGYFASDRKLERVNRDVK